ncbi:MAG: hypothetical protein AB1447_00045 [Bacillota bacterium]
MSLLHRWYRPIAKAPPQVKGGRRSVGLPRLAQLGDGISGWQLVQTVLGFDGLLQAVIVYRLENWPRNTA